MRLCLSLSALSELVCLPARLSVRWPIRPCVRPPARSSVHPLARLFVRPSLPAPVRPLVRPCDHPRVRPFVRPRPIRASVLPLNNDYRWVNAGYFQILLKFQNQPFGTSNRFNLTDWMGVVAPIGATPIGDFSLKGKES